MRFAAVEFGLRVISVYDRRFIHDAIGDEVVEVMVESRKLERSLGRKPVKSHLAETRFLGFEIRIAQLDAAAAQIEIGIPFLD